MSNTPASKDFLATVNPSSFSTQGYQQRIDEPWGYELLLTAANSPYVAKIIHINQGSRLSLQVHDAKTETWTVMKGRAGAIIQNAAGELESIELQPGLGYTSTAGQKHRLIGLTDCDILEASTPEIGTTWRLEDDYHRPNETEAVRHQPNRGWKA